MKAAMPRPSAAEVKAQILYARYLEYAAMLSRHAIVPASLEVLIAEAEATHEDMYLLLTRKMVHLIA